MWAESSTNPVNITRDNLIGLFLHYEEQGGDVLTASLDDLVGNFDELRLNVYCQGLTFRERVHMLTPTPPKHPDDNRRMLATTSCQIYDPSQPTQGRYAIWKVPGTPGVTFTWESEKSIQGIARENNITLPDKGLWKKPPLSTPLHIVARQQHNKILIEWALGLTVVVVPSFFIWKRWRRKRSSQLASLAG